MTYENFYFNVLEFSQDGRFLIYAGNNFLIQIAKINMDEKILEEIMIMEG